MMAKLLEDMYEAATGAAPIPGEPLPGVGALDGIASVWLGPEPPAAIPTQLDPSLTIEFVQEDTPTAEADAYRLSGNVTLRLFTSSMEGPGPAQQEMLRLLMSDDQTKGLLPFLKAKQGYETTNGKGIFIRPQRVQVLRGGDASSYTFMAVVPLKFDFWE